MLKTESSLKQLAREIVDCLAEDVRVEKIILFGSYLSGVQREDSDIDMAVVSKDFEKMGVMDKIELFAKASMAVDSRIELVGFSQKDYLTPPPVSLLALIKKTGKIIYS